MPATKPAGDDLPPLGAVESDYRQYAKSDHADEDYIFPILDRRIHKTEQQIYDRVRKVLKHVNKALHEWSRLLGLKIELTTYVAKHHTISI